MWVKGSRSDSLQEDLEDLLAEDYDLVAHAQFREEATRLDAPKMTAQHIARVATAMDVDAVLTGRLKKEGDKDFKLDLRLRDGSSGETLERLRLSLSDRELGWRQRTTVTARFSPTLDEMGNADEDDEASDDEGRTEDSDDEGHTEDSGGDDRTADSDDDDLDRASERDRRRARTSDDDDRDRIARDSRRDRDRERDRRRSRASDDDDRDRNARVSSRDRDRERDRRRSRASDDDDRDRNARVS
ncbi:MAG: hypothetical protein AAGC55_17840, partial [Myxococcota bacterium]